MGCGGGGSTPSPSPGPVPSPTPAPSPTPGLPIGSFDCQDIQIPAVQAPLSTNDLSIDGNQLLLNGDAFFAKGLVFEIFYPGESPGSSDPVPDDMPFYCMFDKAAELNANLVYTSFGGAEQMRTDYFEAAAHHNIDLVMGIWFSPEADNYQGQRGDFQSPAFKSHVRGLIESMVDTLHQGLARDYSSQVLYFNIGNEMAEWAVNNTNTLHPDITSYTGTYISAPGGSNATEAFLAEMADYLKVYEQTNYGSNKAVTHTTWPVVSPALVDTSFLDIVSYNLYSYWPAFVSEHAPGSVSGTAYQGALEELAAQAVTKPFIVSEFGSSTSPESVLENTFSEQGQADNFSMQWNDIVTGPENVEGALVFELVDQWHKNDHLHTDGSSIPSRHDRSDSEEWFGIVELESINNEFIFREKPVFEVIKAAWQ
jgi:hypothetical protein